MRHPSMDSTAASVIDANQPELEPTTAALSAAAAPDSSGAAREEQSTDPRVGSRRQLLRLGALATAALGSSLTRVRAAGAQVRQPRSPAPKAPQAPTVRADILSRAAPAPAAWMIDPVSEWTDPTLRLARRITLGLTDAEAKRAKQLGFAKYLEYQLSYRAIDDSSSEAFVARTYPTLAMNGTQLSSSDVTMVQTQLQEATLYRGAFSQRQLYQRMVEFWSDHFTIYIAKVGYLKTLDDRDVIRKYALTNFPLLLKASAHSPAMLAYLDNTQSRGRTPNQNYARELMELHTMGSEGGYTQQDVAEVSRCLTGWTIAGRGQFNFDATGHDFTAKTVLGTTIPAMAASAGLAGKSDGDTVLNMLIAHPSTARFIGTKMLHWLLRPDPTQAQIDAVAATYMRTGGDIPSMIRTILTPTNVMAAPAKHKRPYHFGVSALRALGPSVTSMANVRRQLDVCGMPLFLWETPDGWSDKMEFWAGLVVPRWNFASYLANTNAADIAVDVTALTRLGTADLVATEIGRMVYAGEMSQRTKDELVAYLTPAPTSAARIRETLALALSASSFQWY